MNEQDQQLNRSDVFEVNGVQFQAAIQSPIPIPILPWRKIPVKFGMFVTNQTSTRLYFNRSGSLLLMLVDEAGREIAVDSDILRPEIRSQPGYFVETTETQFFNFDSSIYRNFCNLQLKTFGEADGFYYFRNLKSSHYQISIIYEIQESWSRLLRRKRDDNYSGKGWWGKVTIPVNFHIGYK